MMTANSSANDTIRAAEQTVTWTQQANNDFVF
jgi:hypothetical protein